MKIVVSPAKTLDFETKLPTAKGTQPIFLNEAEELNSKLSNKSKKAIKELMSISDALAELNYSRYKEFSTPFTNQNARPAAYTFAGDVYSGLDAFTLPESKIDAMQNSLRILSGMYGVLKPLDLMQAYRLEMGTSLKMGKNNNLYEFWGDKVTNALNQELDEDELFINLASQEYFKVINAKKLKTKVISPVFKDYKNGKLKVISFFAKKARGSMARFAIENNVATLKDLLTFNKDDYAYSEEHTQKEHEPVFIR